MDADELIARFGSKVYNLALRLTGNSADAADVAQDALIKAVRGLSGFRGGDPGVWTYRITVNAWKNFVREQSTRRMLRFISADGDGIENEPANVPSNEAGPEAAAIAADEKSRIERALKKLTPEERAVLVLRELDGRSYDEIAESLSLPLGTVKSRLARARAVLAEELSEVTQDDA